MIRVKTNVKAFVLDFKKYTKALDDANFQAVKKVSKQAKTFASSEIRNEYNIKKVDLDKHIHVFTPTKKNLTDYTARIVSAKPNIPLYKFGARKKGKYVSVMVKKGVRKIMKNVFIATMKSGHTGIFKRREPGTGYTTGRPLTSSPNLKIDEKFAKGAGHLITKKIFNKIEKFVEQKFPKLLEHEINYRTKK